MATVKELRAQCKARAIKGYSRLRKADLIEVLAAHNVPQRRRQQAAVCAVRVDRSDTLREAIGRSAMEPQMPGGDHAALIAVLTEKIAALNILIAEKDVRYNQRFSAQEVALVAAMNASDKSITATKSALETAMVASEKAIGAAKSALDTAIIERDERYSQRFVAQEKAVEYARMEANKALTTASASLDSASHAAEKAIIKAETNVERRLEAAMAAAKEAITKAELATERRFESVNEFRGTLMDQQENFARKQEVEIRFKTVEDKLEMVLGRSLEAGGKGQGINAAWVYLVGACVLATSVIGAIAAVWRA